MSLLGCKASASPSFHFPLPICHNPHTFTSLSLML